MKTVVKVDSKGRITLPLFIREKVNIEPDSYVEIELPEGGKELILKPFVKSGQLVDLEVRLKSIEELQTLLDIIQAEGAELKILKCRASPEGVTCETSVVVLDYVMARKLRERLEGEGLKAIIR